MARFFEQSSVLITGASRGIGRNIALVFARETSFPLLLIARSADKLEETARLCRKEGAEKVGWMSCDLRDEDEVDALKIPDDFPAPGVLVNNAGHFLLKSLRDTHPAEYLEQFESNTLSAFLVVRRFLDGVLELERGLIVNIGSVSGEEGRARSGAYAAAKHALLGYTRSLRLELMDEGVAVTSIQLGQTMSTSWEGMNVDPELLIDPEDVGRLIVSLTRLSPRTVAEEIKLRPRHGDIPPDGF